MENIVKKFYDLGYCLDFANNVIIISSLSSEIVIYLRIDTKEFRIINFNAKYVLKFDINLISLMNSLLIHYTCDKYIDIFGKEGK